jgi:hypothetical protein
VSAAESSHIPPPTPVDASSKKADDGDKKVAPTTSKAKSGSGKVATKDSKAAKDSKKDGDDEKTEAAAPLKPVIESLYLHVQVSNTEARAFWENAGFEVKVSKVDSIGSDREISLERVSDLFIGCCLPQETVKDYYRKLEPRDAWLLERKITRPSAAT